MEESKTFRVSKKAVHFFDEILKIKAEKKQQTRDRYKQGKLCAE
jgi:hypothetical protein